MQRIPEPELMDEFDQARAYAAADFSEPNERFVELFLATFPGFDRGTILDLGCGPGDIALRLAGRLPDVPIPVSSSSSCSSSVRPVERSKSSMSSA